MDGYPPDQQEAATRLVLRQAETLSSISTGDEAAQAPYLEVERHS
jgi:hypothetical protein